MTITIYHNPACGTSRNVLEILKATGKKVEIVEYLKNPPSKKELEELIKKMGIPVREILRQLGTPYDELKLNDPKWTDDQLLGFIVEYPILMNRPIVVTSKGAKLCRPVEAVNEIL